MREKERSCAGHERSERKARATVCRAPGTVETQKYGTKEGVEGQAEASADSKDGKCKRGLGSGLGLGLANI